MSFWVTRTSWQGGNSKQDDSSWVSVTCPGCAYLLWLIYLQDSLRPPTLPSVLLVFSSAVCPELAHCLQGGRWGRTSGSGGITEAGRFLFQIVLAALGPFGSDRNCSYEWRAMQTPCVQTPVSCFLWTFTLLQKGPQVPWDRPDFGCHHQCIPLGLT